MELKNNMIDEKTTDKIIRTAYGDAGFFEKILVQLKAKSNPDVKRLLNEYKSTAYSIKSIEPYECPDYLLEKISKEKNITKLTEESFWLNVFGFAAHRPMFSTAAGAVLIVSLLTLFFMSTQENKYEQYTQEEVEFAEQQVKTSLKIVGKVFKKTQIKLEDEIIDKQVREPFNQSFKIINNLFIGG